MSDDAELKKAGLKVTLPRLRILELLEHDDKGHLSAEEIYRRLIEAGEEVGVATVYRVLTQFETAGLVTRHYFEGGHSVFELESGEHHDHLVCMETGKVIEFQNDTIEALQEQIAEELGYDLGDHNLVLYGKPKS